MSEIPLNKHFKFVATIGKGAYGSVFLVKNTMAPKNDSPPFAIKVLQDPEDDEQIQNIQNELEIMQALQGCLFTVKMFANTYQKNQFYFIMEFINGGDLFYHLRKAKRFNHDRA